MSRVFKVIIQPEGLGWLVSIPSVRACYTDGRSIPEALFNIREALAVSLDGDDRDVVAEAAVFEIVYRSPGGGYLKYTEVQHCSPWCKGYTFSMFEDSMEECFECRLTREHARFYFWSVIIFFVMWGWCLFA